MDAPITISSSQQPAIFIDILSLSIQIRLIILIISNWDGGERGGQIKNPPNESECGYSILNLAATVTLASPMSHYLKRAEQKPVSCIVFSEHPHRRITEQEEDERVDKPC